MDSENQRRGPGRPPRPRTDATAELLAQLEGTAAAVVEPEAQDAPVTQEPVIEPQPASDDPLTGIPRDGRAVMLLHPKGGAVKAYWRETRHFHNGGWQSRAFWAHWRGPDPIQFDPTGWGEAQ